MSKFNSTRNKIVNVDKKLSTNEISIEQLSTKKYITISNNFFKQKTKITVLDKVYIQPNVVYKSEYRFVNINENQLKFINPIFYISTDDYVNLEVETLSVGNQYKYLWKKSGNDYIFKFRFSGQITYEGSRPIYMTLYFLIFNPSHNYEVSKTNV